MSSGEHWDNPKMIKTVLLDLDDTLILNPNQGFVPRYLQSVDDFFMRRWGQSISKTLVESVRTMSQVRDMQQNNLQLATTLLQRATDQSEADIHAALHEFYTTAYPELQDCTQPVEGAPELVKALKERGYGVVIATNPIYPSGAIQQRLLWAGLSVNFDDYAFVTCADNMHFAKPHPAYYAEILGRVGIEPDEAIMIGDSIRNDIEPAALIGLHTQYIKPGNVGDFQTQLLELDILIPPVITPESVIYQWQGNLGALFGIIDTIKPHYWNQHPDPEEWSPLQIVCHLLEREPTVHRQRLERILAENNPFITDLGLPPGPREAIPCDTDGYHAAEHFLQERLLTIALVEKLTAEEWMRPARHSIFGPTTLLEMALFTAQHDRLHLKQLCQTTGKCT
ncbi:MAG TPA: HAD-IA family hydrolase [Phototrophicaceae bacterium]|jgi:HAD superfamily hydrolase (TIGR01549 family)|nr:HAD-IA family hydrolase [Phototrophicaceae bacterium]